MRPRAQPTSCGPVRLERRGRAARHASGLTPCFCSRTAGVQRSIPGKSDPPDDVHCCACFSVARRRTCRGAAGRDEPVRSHAAISIEQHQRCTVFLDATRERRTQRSGAFKNFFVSIGEHPKFKQKAGDDSFPTRRRTGQVHSDAVAIGLGERSTFSTIEALH
jgi:hypothetical protein